MKTKSICPSCGHNHVTLVDTEDRFGGAKVRIWECDECGQTGETPDFWVGED